MRNLWILIIGILCLSISIGAQSFNTTNEEQDESSLSQCLHKPCTASEGRTFGIRINRRMQFIFLPLMFMMGVALTLLVGLTTLAFKGLAMGVMLLVLTFNGFLSNMKAGKFGGGAPPVEVIFYGANGQVMKPSSSYPFGRGNGGILGNKLNAYKNFKASKFSKFRL